MKSLGIIGPVLTPAILLFLVSIASAQPQCPVAKTYTLDADFALGVSSNVIAGPGAGQLQLERVPPPMYPYLNVACSGRGTIVRIDVGDRKAEGDR